MFFGDKKLEFKNSLYDQYVLYATIALYIIALIICLVMVRPTEKALEAKKAKKNQ